MAEQLYVSVDPSKCVGHTMCAQTAPEVYTLVDGFGEAIAERVPLGLEDQARAGAAACPENAIYVGETPPPDA